MSVDATGVPQQGPGGVTAEERMPWVAMVYNPVPETYEGRRPPDARSGAHGSRWTARMPEWSLPLGS
ncbi:MAG: hypothetical protein HY000_25355 [Planctomycetes bacterium]|nr:hypothetical protein [Planctomycetota bacterium]